MKPMSLLRRTTNLFSLIALGFGSTTALTIISENDYDSARSAEQTQGHESAPAPSSSPETAPAAPAETAAAKVSDEDACVIGAAAIEDMRAQREKIQLREKELAQKEGELKALQGAVQDEFKKLEQLRADMAKVETLKKKENEEKVAKIVETLEGMSPKAASQLLGTLDEALAVTAMQRMSTAKLAKVMNVMEPGRSSRLTELLAGVARVRSVLPQSASNGAAVAADQSRKGGDKNDSNSEQQPVGGQGIGTKRP